MPEFRQTPDRTPCSPRVTRHVGLTGVRAPILKGRGEAMDTYNIYMDELPTGEEIDGEEMVEVEFRVVPGSEEDSAAEITAVIAGLDLVDLINLRDSLQQEIDNFALSALEAQASAGAGAGTPVG